jgi:5-bromo-4-chloroindolyl phosphate hydrolysis protein
MNKRTGLDGLWTSIIAVVSFGVIFFLTGGVFFLLGQLLVSIIVALVVFAACWFFLFKGKRPEVMAEEAKLKTALEDGRLKLNQIRSFESKIRRPTIRTNIENIASSFEDILDAIKADPSKLHNANQLLDYYVPTTITIISKYLDLSSQKVGSSSTDTQKSLINVESTLGKIKDAFDAFHARLLTNDVMNLDNELATLNQTINMDGLGKDQ